MSVRLYVFLLFLCVYSWYAIDFFLVLFSGLLDVCLQFWFQMATTFLFFTRVCVCVCVCVCVYVCVSWFLPPFVYNLCSILCRLKSLLCFFSFYLMRCVVLCLIIRHCVNTAIQNLYICFGTFTFLLSGNLILLLWSDSLY